MRHKEEIQRIKSEKSHIQCSNGAGVLVMLGIMLMKSLLKISPFPCHSPSSGRAGPSEHQGEGGGVLKIARGENTWSPAWEDWNYFESPWLEEVMNRPVNIGMIKRDHKLSEQELASFMYFH